MFTYIGAEKANPNEGMYVSFGEYQGADEYSING